MARRDDEMIYYDGGAFTVEDECLRGAAFVKVVIRKYHDAHGGNPDKVWVNPDVHAPNKVDGVQVYETTLVIHGCGFAGKFDPDIEYMRID